MKRNVQKNMKSKDDIKKKGGYFALPLFCAALPHILQKITHKNNQTNKADEKILYLLASVSEASRLLDEGGHFRGQALREVPVAGQQCLSANRRVLHTVKRDATNLFSMRDANKKRRKRKGVEVRRKEEECML